MNHQNNMHQQSTSEGSVGGQRVNMQVIPSHQVMSDPGQHNPGSQGTVQNIIHSVISDPQEQAKVVLVTMPDGLGGSGEGDVEIIVTTHLSPTDDESMFDLTGNAGQYQQLENMSAAGMELPRSVCEYNTSLLPPAHQLDNNTSLLNQTVQLDNTTSTICQETGHPTHHMRTYQPINTTANAIYNSAISSGIIPSTRGTGYSSAISSSIIAPTQGSGYSSSIANDMIQSNQGTVYSSAVSSIEPSTFHSPVNTLSDQQMISLTRYPPSLDQGNTSAPGAVALQIVTMADTGTSVVGHQTSSAQTAAVQTPDLNTMTPEDRELYEKQETMKSLELVEAQWKSSVAEAPPPQSPECLMFPADVREGGGGVEGDGPVFAYKVMDITSENEHVMKEDNGCGKVDINTLFDDDGTDKVIEKTSDDDVVCTICNKTFCDIELLQSHVMQHIKKDFSCSICQETFVDAPSLRKHKTSHSEKFSCKECNKSFGTAAYLKAHQRTHTGEKIHVCDVCDESFTFPNMLRRHKIKFHKEVLETCNICDKEFTSAALLKKHGKEHEHADTIPTRKSSRKRKAPTGRKNKASKIKKSTKMTSVQMKVKVPVAGSRPQTRGQKKKEAAKEQRNSPQKSVFRCIICQEKFSSKIQLKKHGRKHLGQRILRCDKCGKVFQDSIKLKMHKLSHSGQTFSCDFCGRNFSYASTLAMHKKSHVKEKGFPCKTCGKKFATADLLKTHRAAHTATKAWVCDVCEKAFTSQYYLKAHKRLHTGEKHYGCLQCGEAFMFSTGLRRHVIKAHGGQENKSASGEDEDSSVARDEFRQLSLSYNDEETTLDNDVSDIGPLGAVEAEEESCSEAVQDMKLTSSLINVSKDEDGMLVCQFCDKRFQSTPALHTHVKEHVNLPYTCKICKKTFSRKLYLQKHLQRHNDARPFNCSTCGKNFRTANYLDQHQQIHTGEKNYQCQLCDQEFIFANSLRRHLKTHDNLGPNIQGMVRRKRKNEKKYRPVSEFSPDNVSQLNCVLCGQQFQTVSQLDQHVKTHTGENPLYECSVCNKEFNTHRALWRHRQSHVDDKPITCEICNKTFRSSYYLKSHMNLHSGKRPYKCKHCDMTFVYPSTRRRHQRTHMTEESMNFMCSICGKKFYEQGEIDRHILAHSGEKPFMCDICGKTFATKALLRSHMNRHNGERQFKCQICNKTFLYRYRLQRHIKTHGGEKAFSCNMCGKAFLTHAYLQTHLRFHTGEKPYKCEVCGEEFSFSNTFRRHKRIHSGQTLNCEVCGKMCLELFDLKRHMQSHSDQKSVMCDICGKTFSHQGSCKRHMKRIHPEAVMPFQLPESSYMEIQEL